MPYESPALANVPTDVQAARTRPRGDARRLRRRLRQLRQAAGSRPRASPRPRPSTTWPSRPTRTCSWSRTRRRRRPGWRSCWPPSPSTATDGWQALLERPPQANGVKVVDGWTEAYSTDFSGSAGKGPEPLVVSATARARRPRSSTHRSEADRAADRRRSPTCFRQVEFAGILKGTKHEAEARQLVDFMLGETLQADLPLNMYVFPVRQASRCPRCSPSSRRCRQHRSACRRTTSTSTARSGSTSGPTSVLR